MEWKSNLNTLKHTFLYCFNGNFSRCSLQMLHSHLPDKGREENSRSQKKTCIYFYIKRWILTKVWNFTFFYWVLQVEKKYSRWQPITVMTATSSRKKNPTDARENVYHLCCFFADGKGCASVLGCIRGIALYVKTACFGVFWKYFFSTSTPPRHTFQVSFERGISLLEH